MTPVFISGFISGFIILILITAAMWVKKIKRVCEQDVAARFEGHVILRQYSGANYFGQESLGFMQVRGNGVLVLTKEQLFFQMWKPKRQLEIPVASILDVTTAMSHLGKSKMVPLLKVVFVNADERTDSVAWVVRDLESWKAELSQVMPCR